MAAARAAWDCRLLPLVLLVLLPVQLLRPLQPVRCGLCRCSGRLAAYEAVDDNDGVNNDCYCYCSNNRRLFAATQHHSHLSHNPHANVCTLTEKLAHNLDTQSITASAQNNFTEHYATGVEFGQHYVRPQIVHHRIRVSKSQQQSNEGGDNTAGQCECMH